MSLKAAAKHIAAQGRNGDSMLVHMTPREVAGLQAIAKANGTSLTTNPQTGLPEAFALESLVPSMVGTALATDNLGKGLLAGLGAYRGLSMAEGLFGDGERAQPKSKDNPYRYRFSMNPTGVRPSGMDEEQQYFKPSYTALADGGVTRMAEGGNPYSYEYDPVLQRYVEKNTAPKSIADPDGFESDLLGVKKKPSEGSGYETTRPKSVEDYLTWEETTDAGKAARADRMQGVQALLSYALPGASLAAYAQGRELMPLGQAFSQTFGTPQSYKDYLAEFAAGMNPVNGPGTIGSRDLYGANERPPGAVPDLDNLTFGYENVGGPGMYGGRSTGVEVGGPISTPDVRGSDLGPSGDYGNPGGSEGGGWGGVGGEGTAGSNGPGDGTAADYARGGLAALAQGGISHLGDYSDGGRLLRGPGDGVSDSIPATIGDKRPARLADGEFVVPARIVSELGNGSTEAGARKLYAMMDRIQKNRSKTVGKGKVAVNSRSDKALPA